MDSKTIIDFIVLGLQAFITNSGQGFANKFGEDCYLKVKSFFNKDEEIAIIEKFETAPNEEDLINDIKILLLNAHLKNDDFKKLMMLNTRITPSQSYILKKDLNLMAKIKNEIEKRSGWWLQATGSNKGDLKIQIEQLEFDLVDLEGKVFKMISFTSIEE